MTKKIIIVLVVLAIIGVITATSMLVIDYYVSRERFPKNTFIENVDISLLTPYEAIKRLKAADIDYACPTPLTIYIYDKRFSYSPSELGVYINAQATIRRAFAIVHSSSYLKNLAERMKLKTRSLSLSLDIDDEILAPVVDDLQDKVNQPTKEAYVEFSGRNSWRIVSEEVGIKMLPQETISSIKSQLRHGERIFQIQAIISEPKITYDILAPNPPVHLLGKFLTYYGSHDSPNRIHNIKAIAGKLNNTLLLSGESFSLLEKIGSFDADSGLKEAFVIIGNELVPEYGGGTCQIATTLYNAVSLADLKVIQRRNHSIWFNIYPLGRDATVYPPRTDFKFKNTTGAPVLIHAIAKDRSLTFKVLGTPASKEVTFSNLEITAWNSEESKWEKSLRVPSDNRKFRTVITRTVKQNDRIIEKEEIKSYYKMVGDREYVKIKRPEPKE